MNFAPDNFTVFLWNHIQFNQESEQVETRNPYQPPCFHAFIDIQPQPRDRRAPPLIGLRAL
jgi:hypothetical protein